MSATTAFGTALLNLLLKNAALANVGDAAGIQPAATVGDLYISLHTADPGVGGSQTSSEATYTGYARVAVARTAGGWTVAGLNFSNTAAVVFPTATAGNSTITHFGIGSAAAGAGNLQLVGTIPAPVTVSSGITPKFDVGQLTGSIS